MPTIRLPYGPSVNHYWGQRVVLPRRWAPAVKAISGPFWRSVACYFIGKGSYPTTQKYVTKKGVEYRAEVLAAVKKKWPKLSATTREVEVVIRAVMPDRRKRDVDNIQKSVLDALTHAGIWVDDSQVWRLVTERGDVCKPGWLEVELIPREKPVKERQLTLETKGK